MGKKIGINESRRIFLKKGKYIPPVILGVVTLGNHPLAAVPLNNNNNKKLRKEKCQSGIIVISAGGNACCPCVPNDPKYNPKKCNQERQELLKKGMK